MRFQRLLRPCGTGVLALFLLSVSAHRVSAVSVQGRLSSTSFVYQTAGDDAHRELDLINRLGWDALEIGHPSISLHFLGTLRGEMLNADSPDPRTKIYRGNVEFAPSRNFKFSLGRQWIYAGVGSALLDGARVDLKAGGLGSLTLYTGSRHLEDSGGDSFPNFSDFGSVLGGHYRYGSLPMGAILGLSAARFQENDQLVEQRLGASLMLPDLPLGRLAYELRYETESSKLYLSHLRLTGKRGATSYGLTWNLKDGYLPFYSDSWIARRFYNEEWFADSVGRRRHEIRAQAGFPCRLNPHFRWTAAIVEIFPEKGDRGDGLELSLAGRGFRAGFRTQRGYRGDRNGFFGSYRRALRKNTWIWLDLNRQAYRYGDESISEQAVNDDYSMASRLGLDHDCRRFPLELRLIFESLRTPQVDYENRFIGMIAYRFRSSNGQED